LKFHVQKDFSPLLLHLLGVMNHTALTVDIDICNAVNVNDLEVDNAVL
jgi:hypothetical protein